MRKKMKKVLAVIMSVALMFADAPLMANAAGTGDATTGTNGPWDDTAYTANQDCEVFPNVSVDEFTDGLSFNGELTNDDGTVYQVDSTSPGPNKATSAATELTEDSSAIMGFESYAVPEQLVQVVLSPHKTEITKTGSKAGVLSPKKIAEITATITDASGTDITGDCLIGIGATNKKEAGNPICDAGLTLAVKAPEVGTYNMHVSMFVNYEVEVDNTQAIDPGYMWYEYMWDGSFTVKTNHKLVLHGFNADGTSKEVSATSEGVEYEWNLTGSTYTPEANTLKRFLGWSTEDKNEALIQETVKSTWNPKTTGSGDYFEDANDATVVTDVYAIFEDIPTTDFTLTYDLQGGVWDTAAPTDNVVTSDKESVMIPVTDLVPRKDGWDFVGWHTDAGATTSNLEAGNKVKVGKSGITIYAIWRKPIVATSPYTINIWGATDAGKEFKFDGPTVNNKLEVVIDPKDISIVGDLAQYAFSAGDIDKYFGNWGSAYSVAVDGCVVDEANRVYGSDAEITLTWNAADGGDINIVFQLIGYAYNVKYYNWIGDSNVAKDDYVYSGVLLTEVPLNPPDAPDRDGYIFKGWNSSGDIGMPLADKVTLSNGTFTSMYGVWQPVQGEYVVKHSYWVKAVDGTLTQEGEVISDVMTGDVGKKLVMNKDDRDNIIVTASNIYEADMGSHYYEIESIPDIPVAIKKDERVSYDIKYVREICVGDVRFTINCNILNADGASISSKQFELNSKYTEGTTIEVDKTTGEVKSSSSVVAGDNPVINLKDTYDGKEITYTIASVSPLTTIVHTQKYEYTVDLEYRVTNGGGQNPSPSPSPSPSPAPNKVNVKMHHEYYVDDGNGNLTKEGEFDGWVKDVEVGTDINKAFHDANHNPKDAAVFKVGDTVRTYTEYERSADFKVADNGNNTYTIKYKRLKGVKYTVVHKYFVNNEGSTYVFETEIKEFGEEPAGTRINIASSDPNCVIVPMKPVITHNGRQLTYVLASADPEIAIAADGSTVYTIRYERKYTHDDAATNTSYTVNHEYYIVNSNGEKTKEGVLTETAIGTAGVKIGTVSDNSTGFITIQQKPNYSVNGTNYTYTKYEDSGVQTISEVGNTIYTIKYMRQAANDSTRMGSYVVKHDKYKQDGNGNWVVESSVSSEVKFAPVGSVVGVKDGNNNVTIEVDKMTFKETEGTKVREYEYRQSTPPITIVADKQLTVTLSYYYKEYDQAATPTPTPTPAPTNKPTGSGNTSSNNGSKPVDTNQAPQTFDDFHVSPMLFVSAFIIVGCVVLLLDDNKKKKMVLA